MGAAVTNAITNVWCLMEVRRKLGLFPYSRSYWRLLPPVGGSLAVLLMLRTVLKQCNRNGSVVAAGSLAYLSFHRYRAWRVGLDADDRLIARAVWSRVARRTAGGEGNA